MLVTFYSEAYENIVMFESTALLMLKLMGHSETIPGALLAKELPQALTSLQKEIEKAKRFGHEHTHQESEVSLANRAFPLINMIKAAVAKNCNVMWKPVEHVDI